MRILLISPKYDQYIVAPHLGLGYLSSSLKKDGHEVKILDGAREETTYNPEEWDIIGVTAMSTYFPECCMEVEKAKSFGLKTIIGGPHIICDPEQSLIDSQADYAAIGEGERTINQLASGVEPHLVEGLVYWKDGKAVRSKPIDKSLIATKEMYKLRIGDQTRDFKIDIDDFGQPDWESIDPRSYPPVPHGMIAKGYPLAPIITTRGCPYSCTFCSAPITAGKRMRYRDPQKVVDEIEMLVNEYGVKEVQIEDDNFTLTRSHVVDVCNEIIKRKIKIFWSLPNGVRIDKLDYELLRLMKKSGCWMMSLGIESGSQRILDLIKKRLSKDVVKETVQDIRDAGIEAVGFFIIGFPTETKEEILETINFACSLPLNRAQFGKATPLPGTELYYIWLEKYAKNEKIDWKTFNYYQFYADWSECTAREISKLQTKAVFKFYCSQFRLFKTIASLRPAQYLSFFKRVIRILLSTSFYNPIFTRRSSNYKFMKTSSQNNT